MKSKKIVAFLLGFTALSCETSHAENLVQAIEAAVKNHPAISASAQSEESMRQAVLEEKSAYYPTAILGASFGRAYSNTTTTRGLSTSRGVGYSWVGDGTANLNQTVFDWSMTDNAVNAASARYMSAEADTKLRQQQIELQTAQSYLQLLRATVLLEKAKANESDMKVFFDRIQSGFNDGGADESEVSRAQDILSLANNAVIQHEADLKIAQANYKEALGALPVDGLIEPSMLFENMPETIDDAIAKAVSANPQIHGLLKSLEAAEFDMEKEEANTLPTLNAEVSALKKDQKDLVGGETEDLRGLLRANWAYDFGGRQGASQKRALHSVKQAEYNLNAMQRVVERDVEIAWASLDLARKQKANEQDRMQAAIKTKETYAEQYEGGQKKILDIMTASNEAFLAEQAYLNIKYQEMNASFILGNAMGQSLLTLVTAENNSDVASAK